MPPLVSALITVYNREKYLAAAIESVLAQTFSDYELIIVDDRSRDRSVEIARRYETDPRVRVYENDHNLGDYPNRNRAASLAQGKYLKYVDADDLIYPHCLELMVEAMEMFPEAGFGVSRAMLGVIAPAQLSSTDAYRDHFFGSGIFSVGPLDTIIRRPAFEQMGGFEAQPYTGDSLCWLNLGKIRSVVIIAPGLVWWRHHEGQQSMAERRNWKIIAEVRARRFRQVIQALNPVTCPLPESERAAAYATASHQYARNIFSALKCLRFALARALVRASGQSLMNLARTLWPSRKDVRVPELSPLRPPRTAPRALPPALATPPVVSVLIPAFNAEAHLPEAIESVLAQGFTDWELIIVDDASTDRTAQIARSYADGNRIRFYRNERNLGKWPNHNRCAELARGKYLKFLHADDLLYPHSLTIGLQMMQARPEAGLGISGPDAPFRVGACLSPLDAVRSEFFSQTRFLMGPGSLFFRTEAFGAAHGFNPDRFPPARDLQLRIASSSPVLLLPQGLSWECRPKRVGYWGEGLYPAGRAAGFPWLADYLWSPICPLPAVERDVAIDNLRHVAHQLITTHLHAGRFSELWNLARNSRIDVFKVLRFRRQWTAPPESFQQQAHAHQLGHLEPAVFHRGMMSERRFVSESWTAASERVQSAEAASTR